MEQEQNQTQELEQSNTPDAGSLDEDQAAEAFGKLDGEVEETAQEQQAEDESTDEESTEESEEEPAEEDDEPELVNVEFDGKEYQVPPELEKALLRQADYSKKTQELAKVQEQAATVQKSATEMFEASQQYAENLAVVLLHEDRVKQLEALDWADLRTKNPAEYAALAADLMTAKTQLNEQVASLQGIKGKITAAQQEQLNTKRAELNDYLKKNVTGWGEKLGTELTAYAVDKGYKFDEIATITDPRWAELAIKAMKYDKLQDSKPGLKDKVKDAPKVLKPGTVPKKVSNKDTAFTHLRKTGSDSAAEAAFAAIERGK